MGTGDCVTVEVKIFLRKHCELETEVFRQWAVVFEKVTNLRASGSEMLHFGT